MKIQPYTKHRNKFLLTFFCCLLTAVNAALGQTWMLVTNLPSGNWSTVAISPDGTKLVAGIPPIAAYTSTNSGLTWITNKVAAGMAASSLDGTKWVCASGDFGVYYSTNSGITWNPTGSGVANTAIVACSADGNILAANGFFRWSTNSGASWNFSSQNPGGFPIFLNNGTKWIAVGSGGIYISADLGVTWITNSVPSTNLIRAASSADGSKLVAVDSFFDNSVQENAPRPLYISDASGSSWIKASAPSNYWTSVASSFDGNRIVAVAGIIASRGNGFPAYNGGIYTSTNGGVSWVSNTVPNTNWISVASSADGSKLVAAVYGGGIYTSFSAAPSPQLNLSSSTTDLVLSWFVPSTNFLLQQNLDLTTANWVTLTNAPTLNFTNMQNQVIFSPTTDSGFYRLMTP